MSRPTNAAASDAAKAVSSAVRSATTRRESAPSAKLKSVCSYMRTRIFQGGVGPCAVADGDAVSGRHRGGREADEQRQQPGESYRTHPRPPMNLRDHKTSPR